MCTLSLEKIPVALRPIIKLPVKNMASIGLQDLINFIDFDEKLVESSR